MSTQHGLLVTSLMLLASLLITQDVLAHSGGLDNCGCHTNSRTGEYHCHGGGRRGSNCSSGEESLEQVAEEMRRNVERAERERAREEAREDRERATARKEESGCSPIGGFFLLVVVGVGLAVWYFTQNSPQRQAVDEWVAEGLEEEHQKARRRSSTAPAPTPAPMIPAPSVLALAPDPWGALVYIQMPPGELAWRKVEAGVYAGVIGEEIVCVVSKADSGKWRVDDPRLPAAEEPLRWFDRLKDAKGAVAQLHAQRHGMS